MKILIHVPIILFTVFYTFAYFNFVPDPNMTFPWIAAATFALALFQVPLMAKKSLLGGYIYLSWIILYPILTFSLFGGVCRYDPDVQTTVFVNNSLKAPLLKYRIDNGSYPTTEEGLGALLKNPDPHNCNWKGPYIKKMYEDEWGNPYQYAYPGRYNQDSYDLWSLGPDQKSSRDDIGNW